jgi:plastocyanin
MEPQAPETPSPNNRRARLTNRNILASVLILLLLIGVTYIFFATSKKTQPPASTPSISSQTPAQAQITISVSGFTPATLQVNALTTVTWTNNDSSPHEVAAEPYPTHDSIAGFNSNVVLQKGDSYSFTFNKGGTYNYNDYLNPLTLKGSVVVK